MTLIEKVKIGFQRWAPKHAITRLVGQLASAKLGAITTSIIRLFIKQYKIDMSSALHSDPSYYDTFNDFFTRELKPDARPIAEENKCIVHPADACVSQFGTINEGEIIQAKGHSYSAQQLLGGDSELFQQFEDGHFATLYLSPKDYHRVHMPCDGTLRQVIYVPGELFSVNPLTAENIESLFARNERIVAIFDTEFGPMAQVLVGATIVGSIETVWSGTMTPPRGNTVYRWNYPAEGANSVVLKKGEEMGRFKLGSTVINLFAKDSIRFDDSMSIGESTVMGTPYAHLNDGKSDTNAEEE